MLRGRAKIVEWTSETVVESAATRPLADPACFSQGGCVRRVGWLQAVRRDETNHAQPLAAIFETIIGERSS